MANVSNFRAQGGAAWTVGGTMTVVSGGGLVLDSGATFTVDGSEFSTSELQALEGVTAGTVTASKAIIVGVNKEIDTLVIADSGLKLGSGAGTAVTATAAELNLLDTATAGTVVASKAVIAGASSELSSVGAISSTGKFSTSSTIAGGASPLHLIQQTNVAGDTYTGTNAVQFKNYDADNTVVHSGGETAGIGVWLKVLSEVADGGEYALGTFHAHGSSTAVIKHGIVIYGDLTNGLSISGGTSTNGIYMENQTNTNEIMFSNATVLITGSATTRSAVRADGGDEAAIGSQYNSSAGKIYFKVANATADADWELVTTTAAD